MDRAGLGSSGCTVLIAAARWNTATSKKREYGASIMVGFMTSREIVWSNPSSQREVLFARKLNTCRIRYGSWAGCSLRTWGRLKPIRLRRSEERRVGKECRAGGHAARSNRTHAT